MKDVHILYLELNGCHKYTKLSKSQPTVCLGSAHFIVYTPCLTIKYKTQFKKQERKPLSKQLNHNYRYINLSESWT